MKPSTLHRMAFRVLAVLAGCLLFATAWAPAASAGSCSGNLSGLIGTPCNSGSLQFTFTSLYGASYAYNYATETETLYSTWGPSDFSVTPVSNGFSLSLNAGPQSLTYPSYGYAYDYAYLYYTVTDLAGKFTGESVTSAGLSSSAGGGYGVSEVYGYTYNPTYSGYVLGEEYSQDGSSNAFQNYLYGAPFSNSPEGFGYAMELEAYYGGSAYWDGTTSFTYDTTSTTPEPASLLLFGTGMLGIAFITRKKLAH